MDQGASIYSKTTVVCKGEWEMIFFTADTHFGHTNIIKFCDRPYDNIEAMDRALIDNWNKVVSPNDTVYHLGDFAFRNSKSLTYYVKQLNGKIHLILGSHDFKSGAYKRDDLFASINTMETIKHEKHEITLCHYAMRVWPKSHYNSLQLYGHSHGGLNPIGKQMDVGVDDTGYCPIHINDVIKRLNERPDNPGLIEKN